MQSLTDLLGNLPPGISDLVSKFDQGRHEETDDGTVSDSYGQVTSQLNKDEYVQAAESAIQRLTPEQRAEFARQLQQEAQQRGVNLPQVQQPTSDPGALANATAQVHEEQPNLLQQMFAPGGTFSSPIAKAVLLGITAMAAKRLTSGNR